MPDLLNVTDELARELRNRGAEDQVSISLIKEAGSDLCRRSVETSSPAAAINALGLLIQDVARELQVPVVHIISVLAVVLMGPDEKEVDHGTADA